MLLVIASILYNPWPDKSDARRNCDVALTQCDTNACCLSVFSSIWGVNVTVTRIKDCCEPSGRQATSELSFDGVEFQLHSPMLQTLTISISISDNNVGAADPQLIRHWSRFVRKNANDVTFEAKAKLRNVSHGAFSTSGWNHERDKASLGGVICTKTEQVSRMRVLRRHAATHLDERPFKCNFCEKSFVLR